MRKGTGKYGRQRCVSCLAALIACVALCAPQGVAARANSAPMYWEGVTGAGTQVLTDTCPVLVERERLVFSVPDFPLTEVAQPSAYAACVSAAYTLYNPKDYTVNVRLAFPFGVVPPYYEFEHAFADGGYSVTVDGQEVQAVLRHTYAYGEFSTQTDTARLQDDYEIDAFYAPDTTVTAYEYTFENIVDGNKRDYAPYASFYIAPCEDRTRVAASQCNGFSTQKEGVKVGAFVQNGQTATVYAIGQPLAAPPQWTVYRNGGEKEKIDGNAALTSVRTCSFEAFALQNYDPDGEVSAVDWYNAVVESARLHSDVGGYARFDLAPTNNLMRWYDYTLSLAALSRCEHVVTAPLYPLIDGGYNPFKYVYTYLLSPAKGWHSFGALDIRVQTPYYMLESDGFDFQADEGGFSLSLQTLPDGELSFTLCASQQPQAVRRKESRWWVVGIVLCIGVLLAAAGGFGVLGYAIYRAAKDSRR